MARALGLQLPSPSLSRFQLAFSPGSQPLHLTPAPSYPHTHSRDSIRLKTPPTPHHHSQCTAHQIGCSKEPPSLDTISQLSGHRSLGCSLYAVRCPLLLTASQPGHKQEKKAERAEAQKALQSG